MPDPSNMHGSILNFPGQVFATLTDKQFTQFKLDKLKLNQVVIAGMGSSAIAFKLISSLYENKFTLPVFLVSNDHLPAWAGKNTLVILSSYSGNSCETLSCARIAVKRQCQIAAISTGGKLLKLVKNHSLLNYQIVPGQLNPCGQPRLGIGFSLAAFLKTLQLFKVIKISQIEIKEIIKYLKSVDMVKLEKLAKKYAQKINRKNVQIVSGGYLSGNAELFAKQLNWNSKQFSAFTQVPEAMHHLLEGVKYPQSDLLGIFVLLRSQQLDKGDLLSLDLTAKYLRKNNRKYLEIDIPGSTRAESLLNCLLLGSFISFHTALLNRIDPVPTPAIEYYKKGLKK